MGDHPLWAMGRRTANSVPAILALAHGDLALHGLDDLLHHVQAGPVPPLWA